MSYSKGLYYNIKPIIDVLDHALALSTPHVHIMTEIDRDVQEFRAQKMPIWRFGLIVSNYSESICSHLTVNYNMLYISVFIFDHGKFSYL